MKKTACQFLQQFEPYAACHCMVMLHRLYRCIKYVFFDIFVAFTEYSSLFHETHIVEIPGLLFCYWCAFEKMVCLV